MEGPALALVWDGTGYGKDGTIWGGEVFELTGTAATRVAHLRPFPLPGGDLAVREPRRSALGLLFAWKQGDLSPEDPLLRGLGFAPEELEVLLQSLHAELNAPWCSSMGRLFDALSALAGLCQTNCYEGKGAILLEHAAASTSDLPAPSLPMRPDPVPQLDWAPFLSEFLELNAQRVPVSRLSRLWHDTLAETAGMLAETFPHTDVLLSGGCFQNRLLTEACVQALRNRKVRAHLHHQVPPNDGGIAYGQLAWLSVHTPSSPQRSTSDPHPVPHL